MEGGGGRGRGRGEEETLARFFPMKRNGDNSLQSKSR